VGHSVNSIAFRAGKSLLWRTLLVSPVNLKYFFFNFSKSFLVFFRYTNYLFKLKYFKLFYKKGFFFSHLQLRRDTVGNFTLKIHLYDPVFRRFAKRLKFFLLRLRNFNYKFRKRNKKNFNRFANLKKSSKKNSIFLTSRFLNRKAVVENQLYHFKSRLLFKRLHKNFFYLFQNNIGNSKLKFYNTSVRSKKNFFKRKIKINTSSYFLLKKFLSSYIKRRVKNYSFSNSLELLKTSFSLHVLSKPIKSRFRLKKKRDVRKYFLGSLPSLNIRLVFNRYATYLLKNFNYDVTRVYAHKEFLKFFDYKPIIQPKHSFFNKTKVLPVSKLVTRTYANKKNFFKSAASNMKFIKFKKLSLFSKVFLLRVKKIFNLYFFGKLKKTSINIFLFYFFLGLLKKYKLKIFLKEKQRTKLKFKKGRKKKKKIFRFMNQTSFFKLFFIFIFYFKKIFNLQRHLFFFQRFYYKGFFFKRLKKKFIKFNSTFYSIILTRILIFKLRKYFKKINIKFYKFLTARFSLFLSYKFKRLLKLGINDNTVNVSIVPINSAKGLTSDVYVNFLRLKIRRRFSFKSLMWPFLKKLKFMKYLKGVYGLGNGRFTRRQRSSTFKVSKGKIGFSTISTYLNYSYLPVITRYGTCGIHIFFNFRKSKVSFKYNHKSIFKLN
jgi:hypothetical protein